MMKRALVGMVCLVTFAAFGTSHAVSDGHYRPDRNHCTTADDNSDNAKYVNPDCKSLIFTISDGTGHEYIGAGTRQTPDGTFANTMDFWVDPGQGQMTTWYVDSSGLHGPTMLPSKGPGDPSTGLFVYFGADDNLDNGEHDSSDIGGGKRWIEHIEILPQGDTQCLRIGRQRSGRDADNDKQQAAHEATPWSS